MCQRSGANHNISIKSLFLHPFHLIIIVCLWEQLSSPNESQQLDRWYRTMITTQDKPQKWTRPDTINFNWDNMCSGFRVKCYSIVSFIDAEFMHIFHFLICRTVDRLWSITEDLNILYKENWTRLAAQEVQLFQVRLSSSWSVFVLDTINHFFNSPFRLWLFPSGHTSAGSQIKF